VSFPNNERKLLLLLENAAKTNGKFNTRNSQALVLIQTILPFFKLGKSNEQLKQIRTLSSSSSEKCCPLNKTI